MPERAAYDVFVSYAAEDEAWVAGYLLAAFDGWGVRWCTEESPSLGGSKIRALERSIVSSDRTVIVVTPAYVADRWSNLVEVLATHYGAEQGTWPVIPVLLRDAVRQDLPLSLRMLKSVEATNPDQWSSAVASLIAQVVHTGPPPPPPVPDCPYPGMAPFGEADSERFYGRTVDVGAAERSLRLAPWLAVVGPSGSGKSSLVLAGLVPRLRATGHEIAVLRPGDRPLESLRRSAAGRVGAGGGRHLVVVIDQLEELFTLAMEQVQGFCDELETYVQAGGTSVVVTLRADYYDRLMSSPLWKSLKDNRLEVLPLRGDELRAAIMRPAHDVDVHVESALVERLVTDAAGEPGALPLVQETLVLLWGRIVWRFLSLDAYETLVMARSPYGEPPRSGLQVALAEHADASLQRLPDDEARATAKLVLLRLVQFMDGREDVRRQLGMDKLAEGLDEQRVQMVVEQLAQARLLTLSAGLPSKLVRVDLSHEAMITGWPALAAWLVERRTAETTRRALEQKADEWDQKGRGLLDDVELADAERWRDSPDAAELGMSDELERLVDASSAAQSARLLREQRINRRFRILSGVLALLLLIAIGGGLAAVVQRNQAQEQRRAALSGELALTAASLPPERLDLALLLSQEAIDLRTNARSTGSLLAALRSNPRVVRVLQPGAPVQSVAVTADGRYVAGGGEDGSVRVWELDTGKEVGSVRRIEGEVRHVVFSPDGGRVAAASSEGVVRQWSTTSSEESAPPLRGHDGSVRALAYDPTGRVLATAGQDHVVILWDAESGADTGRRLDGHTDWVNALAFTPDGTTLLSGGGRTENRSTDQRILAWDVATGALKAVLDGHSDAVRALAVKGDGSQAVSAGADRAVVQWDLAAFTPVRTLTGNTERVFDVAYSTDGRVIASAGRDHTIHLWDSSSGEPLGEPLRAHGAAVRGIAIGGGTLVSGGDDGRIFVWDLDDPDRSRLGSRLRDQSGPVGAVANHPDGLVIATGSNDGRVVLRRADGRPRGAVLQVPGRVNALVFSPDGHRLATLTFDGSLQVWDVETGQLMAGPVETGDVAAVMAWSARGDRLATGGDGRVVRMWDASLQPVGGPLTGHANWVTALSFRKSDDALISAGADGVIQMWTRGSSTPQPINRPASLMTAGIFSPDGRSVITGDREGDVVVWPSDSVSASRTGQRFVSTGGPDVSSLAMSNDGRLLAVGDESGGLHLWDISTSEPQDIGPLGNASGAVRSLAFTPDSSQLISGDDAGAQLWDVDPASWRQVACEIVGRNLGPSEQDDYLGGSPGHHCPGLPEGRDPTEPAAGSDDD